MHQAFGNGLQKIKDADVQIPEKQGMFNSVVGNVCGLDEHFDQKERQEFHGLKVMANTDDYELQDVQDAVRKLAAKKDAPYVALVKEKKIEVVPQLIGNLSDRLKQSGKRLFAWSNAARARWCR